MGSCEGEGMIAVSGIGGSKFKYTRAWHAGVSRRLEAVGVGGRGVGVRGRFFKRGSLSGREQVAGCAMGCAMWCETNVGGPPL